MTWLILQDHSQYLNFSPFEISMTDALTLRDVTRTYRNGCQALNRINLNVSEGELYALLGPNGAGKSTTIGIISSLTRKSSGTVEIFGYDLDTQPSKAKQCLGVVPQEFNFAQFEKTFDILVTQAGYYGIPKKIDRKSTRLKSSHVKTS